MSHFSVLVVTDDDTRDTLAAALQPFHEYECTGIDDEYVVDVDVTEEVMAEWRRADGATGLRLADGAIHNRFDDKFYVEKPRDPDDPFSSQFEFQMPEGAEEITLSEEELAKHTGGTLAQFAEDWNGAFEREGKFFKRTNPNAKWDWWSIGGRYQGMLQVKPGVDDYGVGRPGLMGSTSERGGVDSCRVGDLDLARMKAQAVAERRSAWDETIAKAREVGMDHTAVQIDELRRAYYRKRRAEIEEWTSDPSQDRREHFRVFMGEMFPLGDVFDGFFRSRTTDEDIEIEDWIAAAPPFATFAVLMDGRWYQRGEMGWWGIVSDENDNWLSHFEDLFKSLKPEQWVTVVDCHI